MHVRTGCPFLVGVEQNRLIAVNTSVTQQHGPYVVLMDLPFNASSFTYNMVYESCDSPFLL